MSKDKKNRNKKLLLGTIIYGIGNLGTKFLSFLIVPLYTFYINPADLGDYDLLCTTINLLAPLLTLQISDAAYRWMINNENNIKPCISVTYKVLIINCFFMAILLSILNLFIPIYYCYYFIAILILGRILESLQKLLRGLQKQKLFAVSGILYTAVFLFLNVFLICVQKKGIEALLQSSVISNFITITYILIKEKRLRYFDMKSNVSDLKREMLRYSIPLVPTTLNWWIMNASDRYIIKAFLGSYANGIYAVSYKFPSILSTLYLMFNNSFVDMSMSSEEEDKEYYSKLFEKIYILGFSILLLFIPGTKLICNLILSETYSESSIYVAFLYLGTIFQSFSSFFSVGYLKGKKTSGVAKTSIYGAIVNIIINIMFIKYIGLHAAAISTFLAFFTMYILRVHQTKELFPVYINIKKFVLMFVLAIIYSILSIYTKTFGDCILVSVGIILFIFINRRMIQYCFSKLKRS